MKKLILAISLFLVFTFVNNLAFADNKQEEIFWGYKKSKTISLEEYLYGENSSKDFKYLKLNSNGDVTYKGKVIITPAGAPINDFSCGSSYLWLKIYLVASGAKPREGCDEKNTIKNGEYGLACYLDTPEQIYKTEIEKVIDEEISIIKKNIEKDIDRIQEIYKQSLKAKNRNESTSEYAFMIQSYRRNIEEHEIMFLSKLIDITLNYNYVENKIPTLNNTKALLEFLYPYFKKANINYQKIEELDKYSSQKIKEIDNLIQKL